MKVLYRGTCPYCGTEKVVPRDRSSAPAVFYQHTCAEFGRAWEAWATERPTGPDPWAGCPSPAIELTVDEALTDAVLGDTAQRVAA